MDREKNVSIILQSFFNVTLRSKNLNWLLSTLLTIIVLSNLVLELNNALMATFRFAAGQKSISADDLVVFAEIVYLVSGFTSPWKIQLILLSAHMLVFLGIDASSDRPQEHSPVVSPTMPYPQRKRKNVSTSRKLFSIRFTYIIASLKVSNSLRLLSFWLLGTH